LVCAGTVQSPGKVGEMVQSQATTSYNTPVALVFDGFQKELACFQFPFVGADSINTVWVVEELDLVSCYCEGAKCMPACSFVKHVEDSSIWLKYPSKQMK
jgi:hypothetical protein